MTFRRHHAPVAPLIRHGGRVIDSFRPRLASLSPSCSSRRCTTITHFFAAKLLRRNSEETRVLHEKVSDTRLESRIKCHGNVNKMPSTFDTFTECPLPQRLSSSLCCLSSNSYFRDRANRNRISNYLSPDYLFLFTENTVVRLFV